MLLASLRLGSEAYTASILTELEDRTGREVSAAAVYIALRRLERAGFVETKLRRGTGRNDHRERRFVRVTRPGLAAVRAARERLVRLWDGLSVLAPER